MSKKACPISRREFLWEFRSFRCEGPCNRYVTMSLVCHLHVCGKWSHLHIHTSFKP